MTWLNQPDIDKCVLVEIDYHDGEKRGTLYFASRPYMSKETDTPASTPYDDLVVSVPEIVATIDRGFSIGEVVLRNHEDMFDRWLNNAYQGWPIRVYIGQTDSPKSDFIRIVDGVCDDVRFPSLETVSFTFQDQSEILDREIQTDSMPDSSLQPIAIGKCFNITAKLQDANSLKYRVNDNDCTINEVRDNGVPVGFTNNGDGTFSLLASPAGAITADVVGYTLNGTTAQIVQFLASRVGVANFDSFSFSNYPLTSLGVFIPDGGSARNWITEVMRSTGGYWYFDRLGRLAIGQLNVPSGGITLTITEDDVEQDGARITSVTAPLQKVRMSFGKNYTVQSADSLAGSVDAQRRWFYSRENQEVIINSFVASQYPSAKSSDLIDTYIVSEYHATLEAFRRATLLTNKSGNITVRTVLQPTTISLGDVVNFIYPKWGFQTGILCRVVGFREFPLDNTMEIELWFTRGDCLCPTSKVVRDGMSEMTRYKAIAKDYKSGLDLGPIARSNVSEGLKYRTWMVKYELGSFRLYYESGSSFVLDTSLFTRSGSISNVGLTWDQVGRPFVTWEEAGEVYIWWYDPVAAATVVTKVADGRTPVCTLDERRPEYSADSDIVLFFINTDGGIEYRLQRDRFLVSYPTPVTEGGEAMGLDVLGPTNGRRLRLTFWDANEPLGRLRSLYTQPYPVDAALEKAGVDSELVSGSMRDIVITYDEDAESAETSSSFMSGQMRDINQLYSHTESSEVGSSLISGSMEAKVVMYEYTESSDVESSLISGSMAVKAVLYDETESADIGSTLISGYLGP